MDKRLHYRLLPSQVLIKGSVKGDSECNYELYMVEFVNSSMFLRERVGFKPFVRPNSEAHGECDCHAGSYGLDFKLTASQTRLRALSLLSDQTELLGKQGKFMTTPPKSDKNLICTVLHIALLKYSLAELNILMESTSPLTVAESDIKVFLQKLDFKKNLLLYYPHEFYFKYPIEFNAAVKEIARLVNLSFKSAMQYRRQQRPEYETYMGFIYSDFFVIMELVGDEFRVVDFVNVEKSKIYTRLYNYSLY